MDIMITLSKQNLSKLSAWKLNIYTLINVKIKFAKVEKQLKQWKHKVS